MYIYLQTMPALAMLILCCSYQTKQTCIDVINPLTIIYNANLGIHSIFISISLNTKVNANENSSKTSTTATNV